MPHATADIAITSEFLEAFELLENTNQNVFLTGKAGTGKSTFLKYFRANTNKEVAVVAPTGVAALNVQGQTIHSFFLLKPGFVNALEFKPGKRRVFKTIELLIIDEISMVRADVFDAIDHTLRHARKCNAPFGGIQVCVIGDLFQLSPVVSASEREIYAEHYRSPFFFASKAYDTGDFNVLQFETVHRQKGADLIHILNAIRAGECDTDMLEALNQRLHPRATPAPGTLLLTTTNALAENVNSSKLEKLPTSLRSYAGKLSGKFGLNGERLPAPEQLSLKVGAQVMFVKNDSEGRWVNGTIGTVMKLTEKSITVSVNDDEHEIKAVTWESIAYEVENEKVIEKPLGSYKQFPLILAWAVTIHKSQGKTLERVIIDLGSGAFAAGQLYVALSRCRTLEGIALKRLVTHTDIRCDAEVIEYMRVVDAASADYITVK